MKSLCPSVVLLHLLLFPMTNHAQNQANYDETKVPEYELPDLLKSKNGTVVQDKTAWEDVRREEIFNLFESEVYGILPKDFDDISFQLVKENENPYPELADLEEVNITVARNGRTHSMRINLFLPKNTEDPVPVVLLINYKPANPDGKLVEENFWPVPELLKRGFATASFHAETVAPDDAENYQDGILSTLYPEHLKKQDGMKALGAWGWGAMRAMDYFSQHPLIDASRSILVGHSRAGKAALWASANDPRWSITYANESGCGGAAISRRKYGETLEAINSRFPHWFADNFKKYNNQEDSLPIDQHMLPALIAPRAIYYSSAREDRWADPKGEFLGIKLGSRIHQEIYGKEIQFPDKFESIQGPIHQEAVGYHIREGKHDLSWTDWEIFLDFVNKNL